MASTIDQKYPNPMGVEIKGPEPTPENPGGVHPHTADNVPDPNPPQQIGASIGRSIENPFALGEKLNRLEAALDDVVAMFEAERETLAREGSFEKGKEGIQLFKSWKLELEKIKAGQR